METALPEVTEYVQSLLEADEAITAPVVWGPPTGDDRAAAVVCVGFGSNGQSGEGLREWATLGGGKLDEEITLELAVDCQGMDGTDMKAAYSRSYELAASVERVLREDKGMDELLLKPARLSALRGSYYRVDKTRGHRVFLTLTGTARI